MDQPPLSSFQLGVQYLPSFAIAFLGFYAVIYQDPRIIIFSLAWGICSFGNRIIKKTFQVESWGKRPISKGNCSSVPSTAIKDLDGGFPSSHAAFAGFILAIYFLLYYLPDRATAPLRYDLTLGALVVVSIIVLVNRYTTGCHTPLQIAAGFGEGLIIGGILAKIYINLKG